jgi:cysteinyl-tRNA synthetase
MATQLLGDKIDIHSGGEDLLFPHHECEIAQVEPLTGEKPFVSFWLHVAMVHHNDEKMSKSLGNLVMIDELLNEWHADAVRIYLGMHHYRDAWNHQPNELEWASTLADKIRQATVVKSGSKGRLGATPFQNSFNLALSEDLDTPAAIETINQLVDDILHASQAGMDILDAQKVLHDCSSIFGLRIEDDGPSTDVINGWNKHLKKFY